MRKITNQELGRPSAEEFAAMDKMAVTVVLDNVRSAQNVGAFFRTGDAFAVEKVVLCGITATPPSREIHKSSLGAEFTVAWEHNPSTVDAVECVAVELLGEMMNVNVASAAGSVVGYAVESSANGFGGAIKMVVGFDAEGTVTGVKVLEHAETPGLGDLISKPGSKVELSIVGRNPGKIKMAVTKDGGDVDALTAATITSRAYVGAVDKAFNAYLTKTRGAAADGYSGATALETPAEEQKGGNNE